MNPGTTFDRVYLEIRGRVLSGEWLPGQRIDLIGLADSLDASVTPVRDALYRLVGERLLEQGISDGFVTPGITEPDLRDRYTWSRILLTLCLSMQPKGADYRSFQAGGAIDDLTARLFREVAVLAQNSELQTAVEAVIDQLAHARQTEVRIGIATENEILSLVRAAQERKLAALRSAIVAYHRSRIRQAGKIVRALHRPS